jgi:hypothetical protein
LHCIEILGENASAERKESEKKERFHKAPPHVFGVLAPHKYGDACQILTFNKDLNLVRSVPSNDLQRRLSDGPIDDPLGY